MRRIESKTVGMTVVALTLGALFVLPARAGDEFEDGFKSELGRIAARTAYQIITQRIREAERDVIYDDYETKYGHPPKMLAPGEYLTVVNPEHFVLTAAQCTLLSAAVFGVLSRSWLLFGLGIVNALPTTALMLLEVPGVLLAMVYWLVSTSVCVRAWGRSGPRRAHVSGPDGADPH